jgi:hypothetical protein
MGGTTIVCGVKAEIAEPDLEKPDEGFLGTPPLTHTLTPFLLSTCVLVHLSAERRSSGDVSSAI